MTRAAQGQNQAQQMERLERGGAKEIKRIKAGNHGPAITKERRFLKARL